MGNLKSLFVRFGKEDDGASMAEYAILLGLITVALIAAIGLFANAIENVFSDTTDTLENAT